ncbi:MAG: putative manganese-dependent inorganic diphosphatase [Saccharofermentanaceae bacterium]|nr:putative manganese-dependent inorganic diphosphatase [Saccharofermentanaceae bacterium]
MSEIYVVGHKNPDTDTVVSAMAYAALKHALGEQDYIAARLDHLSDETKRMLARFGFETPLRIRDVRTQVQDLDFDTPPALNAQVTLDKAWRTMSEGKISVIPVINEDGTLYGTLSSGDIASYNMETINNPHIDNLPLFNLLSVLEGRIVNECDTTTDSISGEICIALPQNNKNLLFSSKDSIVFCGNQPDMVKRALTIGVNCLILCQTDVDPSWFSGKTNTCVISTPLDASKAAKLIYQALPISRACYTGEIQCFHLDNYIDDVKEVVLKSRFRSYPVLDENNKVIGTLARFHLLRPRRKKVVLVDHNELAQSVPGLEQAEILGIIDHHRLADIQTTQPIAMRNEPVGSTNTIITELYQESGVMPSPKMAGLMCAAILSDTVMFKSPTCTQRDIAMAERLARIAGVSIDELGHDLFNASFDTKSVEELMKSDFKEFHIAEHTLGVAQIVCIDSFKMLDRKDEFIDHMNKLRSERGYDFVILMLTDVLQEGTELLYVGDDDTIRFAFSVEPKDNHVFLPGVMSRKKQIIPMLTALWG